nr:hypothetical protein [uncultured Schaedlerella sp.]
MKYSAPEITSTGIESVEPRWGYDTDCKVKYECTLSFKCSSFICRKTYRIIYD